MALATRNINTNSITAFPKFLIKQDEHNHISEHILLTILRFAVQQGGYAKCFGYKKKTPSIRNCIDTLFGRDGALNE